MGMTWAAYRVPSEKIASLGREPDALDDLLESVGEDRAVDIDKAWHGIHWLLTGEAWEVSGPLAQAILGGEPLGKSPAAARPDAPTPRQPWWRRWRPRPRMSEAATAPVVNVIDAITVAEVANALATLDSATVRARYDAQQIKKDDIYPNIWDEDPDEVLDEYLMPYFEDLRAFYTKAAEAGESVILIVG